MMFQKKYQVAILVLKLLKIWDNKDKYDQWTQKLNDAERIMNERGFQFS